MSLDRSKIDLIKPFPLPDREVEVGRETWVGIHLMSRPHFTQRALSLASGEKREYEGDQTCPNKSATPLN